MTPATLLSEFKAGLDYILKKIFSSHIHTTYTRPTHGILKKILKTNFLGYHLQECSIYVLYINNTQFCFLDTCLQNYYLCSTFYISLRYSNMLPEDRQKGSKVKGGRAPAPGQSQSGLPSVTPPPNKQPKQGRDRAGGPSPQNQEFGISPVSASS